MNLLFYTLFICLSLLTVGGDNPQLKKNGHNQLSEIIVPAYPAIDTSAHPFLAPGLDFETVITNNSSHPVSLYPYLNRSGMENIAWGDSFLLAYLNSQITGLTDTDEIRLKLIQIVGTKIEKTDLFTHGQVIYFASDNQLYSKQTSLMGSLCGAYQKQCLNYVESSMAILIKTGYFDYGNLRFAHLVEHVVGEFIYKGRWILFDPDPQEPFFMIKTPSGFASAEDVRNNHALVRAEQKYYFIDESKNKIDLANPSISPDAYGRRYDSVTIAPIRFTNGPTTITGDIILPAKARLISEYTTPYILDSASHETLLAIFLDKPKKVIPALANILGISTDSAFALIQENKISLSRSSTTFKCGIIAAKYQPVKK